ncbi:hypothetical protein SS1G_13686 [Sclerotinia sclerotiorum 1980 UF-70]|uniref:C2H2-type domain-containing protein n=1 Tax=Sclerotinia sclerotiorum (strain ATCC 18683 / 1980 / Ss-1) TaxID=665079 RepID=A7F7V6_SCLS1|nr:hypothetical protein SS1G_13686 [Sclerotinia sclerotiorum 1980 UF-70]EDN98827.1 hypothetical protein SS1G_13686 [Sclerotinia sclerotiorum 1980 UF-70]
MGKYNSCWEALDPARQNFIQIAEEIKEHLEKHSDPVTKPVTWTMYMIGRKRETAEPTIMFCSKEEDCRKKVKKTVVESRIWTDTQVFKNITSAPLDLPGRSFENIGHIFMKSPELDYALIETSKTSLQTFNRIALKHPLVRETLYPESIVRTLPLNTIVFAVTSSAGLLEVEARSGNLLGHIVSCCPESGVAYIVPAYLVLEDAKIRCDLELKLTTARDSTTEEEWRLNTPTHGSHLSTKHDLNHDAHIYSATFASSSSKKCPNERKGDGSASLLFNTDLEGNTVKNGNSMQISSPLALDDLTLDNFQYNNTRDSQDAIFGYMLNHASSHSKGKNRELQPDPSINVSNNYSAEQRVCSKPEAADMLLRSVLAALIQGENLSNTFRPAHLTNFIRSFYRTHASGPEETREFIVSIFQSIRNLLSDTRIQDRDDKSYCTFEEVDRAYYKEGWRLDTPTSSETYECYCGKLFPKLEALRKHFNTHSPFQFIACPESNCSHISLRLDSMKKHLEVHSIYIRRLRPDE